MLSGARLSRRLFFTVQFLALVVVAMAVPKTAQADWSFDVKKDGIGIGPMQYAKLTGVKTIWVLERGGGNVTFVIENANASQGEWAGEYTGYYVADPGADFSPNCGTKPLRDGLGNNSEFWGTATFEFVVPWDGMFAIQAKPCRKDPIIELNAFEQ